jgi:hypothetical protein
MTDSGPWRRRGALQKKQRQQRLLINHVAIGDQLNFVFVFSNLIRRKSFFAVFCFVFTEKKNVAGLLHLPT